MSGRRLVAGVLGGMGPAATIDFMAKVLAHSQAARGAGAGEQADVRLIVDSNPGLPDRNAAIAGTGPSPAPGLAEMAQGLARAGADFLVMPCNAAHAFAGVIAAATALPFVSMIDAVVAAVRRDHPAVRRVGVLAVAGTADARLYERAFAPGGIAARVPEAAIRDAFMAHIWRIKAGDTGAAVQAAIIRTAGVLIGQGAELIVAGCTEVPLVLGPGRLTVPLIDATDVLAARTVAVARGAVPV